MAVSYTKLRGNLHRLPGAELGLTATAKHVLSTLIDRVDWNKWEGRVLLCDVASGCMVKPNAITRAIRALDEAGLITGKRRSQGYDVTINADAILALCESPLRGITPKVNHPKGDSESPLRGIVNHPKGDSESPLRGIYHYTVSSQSYDQSPSVDRGNVKTTTALTEAFNKERLTFPAELRGKSPGLAPMWDVEITALDVDDAVAAVHAVAELCRGTERRKARTFEWSALFGPRRIPGGWEEALAWTRHGSSEPDLKREYIMSSDKRKAEGRATVDAAEERDVYDWRMDPSSWDILRDGYADGLDAAREVWDQGRADGVPAEIMGRRP